jgi:AAA domain-containing protein
VASITIVTGCPGTGKTTLAARLAAASERGVHLSGDGFYAFVTRPVSPILPESRAQNTTVTAAVARAAGAFAAGGYDVAVDAVIGPWLLPTFLGEVEAARVPIHYVVLRAGLSDTLVRSRGRSDPGEERIVRHMHAAFEDLGGPAQRRRPRLRRGARLLSDARSRRRRSGGPLPRHPARRGDARERLPSHHRHASAAPAISPPVDGTAPN